MLRGREDGTCSSQVGSGRVVLREPRTAYVLAWVFQMDGDGLALCSRMSTIYSGFCLWPHRAEGPADANPLCGNQQLVGALSWGHLVRPPQGGACAHCECAPSWVSCFPSLLGLPRMCVFLAILTFFVQLVRERGVGSLSRGFVPSFLPSNILSLPPTNLHGDDICCSSNFI